MRDLLVIGGGINGAGIARDAAGRGLSVTLVEKDDLAAHTSSASTKLIHGGLRYLETYDFALVRKALIEREILLRAAPHIIWPMRFVLPHEKALRPAWLVRLGLFFYDHLGGRKLLPPTRVLRRGATDRLDALRADIKLAFEYSDCWVEDSRLTVLTVMDAAARGANIRVRTACTKLVSQDGAWEATFVCANNTETHSFRAVVNAAGSWADDVLGLARPGRNETHLRLVKGSHIVVPRQHDGEHAYFFQNADGRIMFAIPYEHDFTLIGTTDIAYAGTRGKVEISAEEIAYLCEGASDYYRKPITPADVVWTYSGVRPLYDDHAANASKVTRDYVLRREVFDGAPLLSVFGGKITTYRELAEHALQELREDFPDMRAPWTKSAALPGGDWPAPAGETGLAVYALPRLVAHLESEVRREGLTVPEPRLVARLARAYGTRALDVLIAMAKGEAQFFGAGLSDVEARFLVRHEFARTSEDILWRRSRLGLHMQASEIEAFTRWFDAQNIDALTNA